MADLSKAETKLIYACSGAADVGEIADRVARKIASDGFTKMTCLAGIGAGIIQLYEIRQRRRCEYYH